MNATRRTTFWASSALMLSAFAVSLPALGSPAPVNLGEAGNYTILAKTGISTTGVTHIIGDLGLSPAKTIAFTGFGQALAPSGQYSTTTSPSFVSGRMYAADNTPPTPAMLTTAVSNMQAAYTDAAGRPVSLGDLDVGSAGEIGGLNLAAGVYQFTTAVTINSDLTLSGSSTDVWIFQVPGTLSLGSAVPATIHIVLSGGAQAKNVFWQVAGDTTIHDSCVMNGNILDQTMIAMDSGAVLNGKALAQTAVTLIGNTVSSSSAGFGGANNVGAAQAILFPSPARGGSVTVAYGMFAAGQATVLVWNDRGDLVAKVTQQQLSGPQVTVLPVVQGRKDPEKKSADDVKSLIEDAEIDGPLVDWKAKQSTLEYLGTEDVDGTAAYKIKVVRKNGDVNFVYLDPDRFLEIRILTQRIKQGAQEEVETDVGDYEKIGGVFVPFSIESGRKGDPDKQKIVIDKAEANAPVDDAIFHLPAAASK